LKPQARHVFCQNVFRQNVSSGQPFGNQTMPQTRSPFFDDIARLMNDAAGVASGVRREVDVIARTQIERLLASMDMVRREEFEAVREMAILARDENQRLAARIAELEAKIQKDA
jgi:BMFP domain-containing protein YqiC